MGIHISIFKSEVQRQNQPDHVEPVEPVVEPVEPVVEPVEPEEPPLLTDPYRSEDLDEKTRDQLLEEIKSVQISKHIKGHENRKWNLLLLGPCGAGKSSFINSLLSISKGRFTISASVGGDILGNITTKFRSYLCGSFSNLKFYDTAGLMEEEGFDINLLKNILFGKIKEGYDFSLKSNDERNKKYCRQAPTEVDMIHCVIYVVDICSINTMDERFRTKIRMLQMKQINCDVQRVLILTKCDELCDYVKSDEANIYKSRMVRDEIDEARRIFGFIGESIHPIINYGEFVRKLTPKIDVPILLALRQCLDYSENYIQGNMVEGKVRMNYDDEERAES